MKVKSLDQLHISPTAFWDVNLSKLDPEKDSVFIIERVMNRGLMSDIHALFDLYDFERLRKDIVQARDLDKKTLSLCSTIFHIPKENFLCYKKAGKF